MSCEFFFEIALGRDRFLFKEKFNREVYDSWSTSLVVVGLERSIIKVVATFLDLRQIERVFWTAESRR